MLFDRQELFLTEQEKQQGFWVQDDVHLPYPFTPLYGSFQTSAMREGTLKAFETIKSPVKQFYTKLENGYLYQWTKPYEGDIRDRLEEHRKVCGDRFPKMNAILDEYVQNEFLPFYEKLDQFRRNPFSRESALKQLDELYQFYLRAWELHFEIVMPASALVMAMEELYGQLTRSQNTTVIYEWFVGTMNKSLETDRELWKLARLVKQSESLHHLFKKTALESLQVELKNTAEGQEFLYQLQTFLEAYGYRSTQSHEFVAETWIEDPTPALGVIVRYLEQDYDFEREFAKLGQKRKEKFEAAIQSLPEAEGKQAFLQLYDWALDAWGLDEDHHFYIDAMLPAKSRLFFLEIGKFLVQENVLEEANDVCFLYLDELASVLKKSEPVMELVNQRKAEWEENKKRKPAAFYGEPPQHNDPVVERIFGTKAPEIEEASFKGYAASQGTYTGKVRVIHSPSDFSLVQKGEVLVCKTTTPAWTALFSVVGAVITDAGGILCHAATVAREYQLPAVIGTKVGTALLRDGQTVTVDGTQGQVRIHG